MNCLHLLHKLGFILVGILTTLALTSTGRADLPGIDALPRGGVSSGGVTSGGVSSGGVSSGEALPTVPEPSLPSAVPTIPTLPTLPTLPPILDGLVKAIKCPASDQVACLIKNGCSDGASCCALLEKGGISSCLTCGTFDPSMCSLRTGMSSMCTVQENLIHNARMVGCFCSECLVATVISEIGSKGLLNQANTLLRAFEGTVAKILTEKIVGQDPTCNGLVCKEIPINFDPKVVDSIERVKVKAALDCNNLPKLTGMDELLAIGSDAKICPAGNSDPALCIKIAQGKSITLADIDSLFTADQSKACAFQSVSKDFSGTLVLPILIDMDIYGNSNYSVGTLLELEMPFTLGFNLDFKLPTCSAMVASKEKSAQVNVGLRVTKGVTSLKLLPIKSEITGNASRFKKKLFYTALYAFERDLRKKILTDTEIGNCGEELFTELKSLQCSVKFADSLSYTCAPPATLPALNKCKSSLQKRLQIYTDDLLSNVKDMLNTILNEADIPKELTPNW